MFKQLLDEFRSLNKPWSEYSREQHQIDRILIDLVIARQGHPRMVTRLKAMLRAAQ